MIYPTIYKRASSGKIQVWFGETQDEKYRTASGQLDGKKTTTAWTTCESKNIGKVNETSGTEQSTAEMEAMYVKKRRSDYYENIEYIDQKMRVKPMLAYKFEDHEHKIAQNEIVTFQPKLDGFRMIANREGLWTRDGLPMPIGAGHIFEALKPLFELYPDMELDGEAYNHEFRADFNTLSSILRKQTPSTVQLEIARNCIQYWLYDIPSVNGFYSRRYKYLADLIESSNLPGCIRLTPATSAYKADAADKLEEYLADGYEGAMLKREALHEGKRSKNLLKIKKFHDDEFIIRDILTGKGNRDGIASVAVMEDKRGVVFEVGIIGTFEYAKDLLDNKSDHIGQFGTVKYLRLTPDRQVPYGGKLKTVRWA